MTYLEKLKDPRWQKLRLEAMSAAGFMCSCCHNDKSMLSVHHRQYFKGREPWEYSIGQLDVLCGECHASAHTQDDCLLVASSMLSDYGKTPKSRTDFASMIHGCLSTKLPNFLVIDEKFYILGQIIRHTPVGLLSKEDLSVVRDFAAKNPEKFASILKNLSEEVVVE